MLIRNILPNQVDGGLVREVYFKWYNLTFDYSLLRVFGNRVYGKIIYDLKTMMLDLYKEY